MTADVITTSDLSSFSAYGIEACYRFHGYKLYSIRTVNLGNGVYGNALSYYNTSIKSDWTTVYWIWPVLTSTGKTRYERVVLMMINSGAVHQAGKLTQPSVVGSVGLGVQNALSGTTTTGAKLTQTRTFLIQFAQSTHREPRHPVFEGCDLDRQARLPFDGDRPTEGLSSPLEIGQPNRPAT